jgi:hypothetical protein
MQNKGFIANLEDFGIVFDEQQYNSLLDLMRLTLAKNEVLNLTTITDEESFLNKMILDSALAFKDVNLTNKNTNKGINTMHKNLTIQKIVVSVPVSISTPYFLTSKIPNNVIMIKAREKPITGWIASLFLRSLIISFFIVITP